MSGIVGIYQRQGEPVSPEQLSSMVDTLAHRGHDGSKIWHQESVGIGHLMLHTTPESLIEELPYCDRLTGTTITADARIDNRDELIDLLGLRGDRAEKITDSSLILKAYHKWGANCADKLIGDFAFAIWDERQQRFFCGRDPMGIKPFYYYCSATLFAFASEIKALFCLPQIAKEINQLRIAYQLTGCFEDEEITFYKDISRLRPAHSLVVDRESKTSQEYWALDPSRRVKLGSDREYAEAFRELFVEAVRCRLRSAFPVGSTLSGGLDSSSITCTARNLLADSDRQLHTFSAIFPNLPKSDLAWIDERRYMDVVKSGGGLNSHDIRADLLDPLLNWFWQDEEPILGGNMYIHQGMYDSANQQGVRVFLDGVDGDTTVSHGWRYLTSLVYTGQWRELYRELEASRSLGMSRKLVVKEYCIKPFIHEPFNQIKQKLFPQQNYDELINPNFARETEVYSHIQKVASEPFFLTAKKQHLAGMSTGLYPLAMEICDKTATPRLIEPRYPFFDRRLMEFCLAIPLEQKFQKGYARSILRQAMEGILPKEVQWRTNKAKLGSNFQRNLLDCQSQTLEKVMHNSKSIDPLIDISLLKPIYNRYAVEKQPQPGDDMKVLNAATLALWLDRI